MFPVIIIFIITITITLQNTVVRLDFIILFKLDFCLLLVHRRDELIIYNLLFMFNIFLDILVKVRVVLFISCRHALSHSYCICIFVYNDK